MRDCEICRGSRIVRLPVYKKVSLEISSVPTLGEPWREYPCPECGDSVKQDRVAVLDVHTVMDSRCDDPEYINHGRRTAAFRLVDRLLTEDFISFEQDTSNDNNLTFPIVATLGVVSKGQVAKLEQRIAERQDQVAKAVAEEAKRQISNWGSYYGHASLLKREARQQVDDALKRVLHDWSKVRALHEEIA